MLVTVIYFVLYFFLFLICVTATIDYAKSQEKAYYWLSLSLSIFWLIKLIYLILGR